MSLPRAACGPLALCALLLVAGATQAHVTPFTDVRSARAGGLSFLLRAVPDVIYAASPQHLNITVTNTSTGFTVDDLALTLDIHGPGLDVTHEALRAVGDGGYVTKDFEFPRRANYSLSVATVSASGPVRVNMTVSTLPNLPWRILPADDKADYYTNTSGQLGVVLVSPDPAGTAPPISDVEIRIAHWSLDHKRMFYFVDRDLQRSGPDAWTTSYHFNEPGMYHLQFSSRQGNFSWNDTPMLHAFALDAKPPAPAASARAIPSPGLLTSAALVAAGAWAARASRDGRRRR